MNYFHIGLGLIFILGMIKWGNWKNYREYYSTILFLVAGSLYYNHLANDNLLWKWTSTPFTHEFISIMWAISIYPAIVIVFILRLTILILPLLKIKWE